MRLFLNNILFLFVLLSISSCKRENSSVKNASKVQYEITLQKEQNNKILELANNPVQQSDKKIYGVNSILSWNIKDFGQSKNDIEIKAIANIVREFDLVLIQEVVAKHPGGAQAVARLADQLSRMGSKWDYAISDPTQSPSVYMSERYAFLWKTAKVTLKGKPFLDKELSGKVYREPYIANFIFKGSTTPVSVINYHSRKYNDRPEDEIQYFLNYNKRLSSDRILLCGDFNLDEKHEVWIPFYANGFKNALSNESTTLKRKCKNGRYLNHSIDNIYSQGDFEIVEAGSLDFVNDCNNLMASIQLSDHLPIYLLFNN